MISNNIYTRCQCGKPSKILVDKEAGEIFCGRCGVILESKTIGYSEPNEKNNSARHDYGIGTKTPEIRLPNKTNIQRLSGQNKNKKVALLFNEIEIISQKLSITKNMQDEACMIGRKSLKIGAKKYRKKLLAATCVLISCRLNGKPIQFKEIATTANISKKHLWKTYRSVMEEQDINVGYTDDRTKKLINKICAELGLSQKTLLKSLNLFKKIKNTGITTSKHPGTVAAAVVYLVADEKRTMMDVSRVVNISSVSIQAFKKKLKKLDYV